VEFKHRMPEKKKGVVFIISAPSGTGKTTLVKKVMAQLPKLQFSVSFTTRPPRPNEKEGKDYRFLSTSSFQKMVKKGEFLEWAKVLGNYYGTARANIEDLESKGIDVILDIDTQGAKKVMEEIDDAISIFLLPPSPKALKERLLKREGGPLERIKFRLNNAEREIKQAKKYRYIIVNENIDETLEKLKAIIIAEQCRRDKNSILKEKIMK